MQTLTHVFKDPRGSVAPLLGIVLIPLMAAVGAAVDYSRATNVRTGLQAALDSTSLMMSKEAQKLVGTDVDIGAQLDTKARAVFYALFQKAEAQNIALTTRYTPLEDNRFNFRMTGSATVNTTVA